MDNNLPLISVIVPVYKVEKYLDRCVESIVNQTYKNLEIILVDDGSPDNCPQMCDEWSKKDKRIRVIHKKNGGLSDARNAGIDCATGEYISFVDSDDNLHVDFLSVLYNSLIKNKATISICDFKRFDNEMDVMTKIEFPLVENIYTNVEACKMQYTHDNIKFVTAWGKIYNMKLFSELRYPVSKIHEDEFVTFQAFYNSEQIVAINYPLYYYRNNENSIMNQKFTLKGYDIIEALEFRNEYYEEKEEKELVNLTHNKILYTKAMLSIKARNCGIYNQVSEKNKMNLFKSFKILKEFLNYDTYEYFLSQYYPKYIKVQAYIRKIHSLLGGEI